jgi:hypothetical protein
MTGADDEEEDDYAPDGNGDDPEDHEIEEDGEEPDDDDDDDDDANKPGPSTGRKGKELKASARNNSNSKRTHVRRVQQHQIVDDDGPIPVARTAMQQAENIIVKYNNEANVLHQQAIDRGGGPTRQGIDALVRLVVRHIIFSNTERPGIPIPRTEVTKLVADNSASVSKRPGLPSLIIAIAQAKLAECFGMEMVELLKPRLSSKDRIAGQPSTAASTGEGSKHFVLRSIVPPELYAAVVAKQNSAASNGFLAVVLSIIDMSGGSIEEKELWKHLGDLAVEKTIEHPHLGIPQDLLEEFIKKRQLHVERVAGNDGPELYYNIAENAASEIGDQALRSFYEAEFS